MGASFAFTGYWLLGSGFLSGGLILAGGVEIRIALLIGLGAAIVGKMVEWFLIEPVLARVFPSYRSAPGRRP